MGIDSVSSSSPKPVVPQAPVEAPKPVTPAAEATPVGQSTPQPKGSGFDTPAPKPVSITGKYAAPPTDASAVKDDLKGEVAAQRMAGVGPAKAVNPVAVPLDYVEKGGAVVQKGQSGESVKQLQQAMNRDGAKLPEDGKFDAKMETAVREYQKKNGLSADGKVGPDTLKKLMPDADGIKKDPTLSKLDPATQKELADRINKSPKDFESRNRMLDVAKTPGFEKLPAAQQKEMLGVLDKAPKDRALTGDLQKMAGSESFQKLDKDAQSQALSQLQKNVADPKAREAIRDLSTEPGLEKLPAAQQKQLLALQEKAPADKALTLDLQKMARSETFQKLDPDTQALALTQFEKHATDATARGTLQNLVTTPGFGALDKHEQTVFLNEAGGTNDKISKSFRAELDTTLKGLGAGKDSQKADLSKFLKDQNWTEWHTKAGAWNGRTTKATVDGPVTLAKGPFRGHEGPADLYQVKIGKDTIPMMVPQGTPRTEVDKLVETMEALPEPNRQLIKQMVLEKNNNTADPRPFDALHGRVTAYPEKSNMIADQQKSAMIHESAHLIDEQMQKKDPNWNANWHKAMESDIAKSSQYGKKSDGEDFAEAYLTYKMTENDPKEHAEMRAMFPERFKLIDEIEKKAKAGTLAD